MLYRVRFDDRDFSIQPQTLNICLKSSLATSSRWSLWSNMPACDREPIAVWCLLADNKIDHSPMLSLPCFFFGDERHVEMRCCGVTNRLCTSKK